MKRFIFVTIRTIVLAVSMILGLIIDLIVNENEICLMWMGAFILLLIGFFNVIVFVIASWSCHSAFIE